MLKLKFFRQFSWNWGVLVVLLMLGIFFRFYNLEQKIYWHAVRAGGDTLTFRNRDRASFAIPVKQNAGFEQNSKE